MTVPNLTPDLVAEIFKRQKPHLVFIEDQARKMGYGTLNLTLTVRAGEVVKMDITKTIRWLREKGEVEENNLQGE